MGNREGRTPPFFRVGKGEKKREKRKVHTVRGGGRKQRGLEGGGVNPRLAREKKGPRYSPLYRRRGPGVNLKKRSFFPLEKKKREKGGGGKRIGLLVFSGKRNGAGK